jgi:hypothetical protein
LRFKVATMMEKRGDMLVAPQHEPNLTGRTYPVMKEFGRPRFRALIAR